jgi:hypothetical protein
MSGPNDAPIDVTNVWLVGVDGSGRLRMQNPPARPITPREALVLAAWLFVLSGLNREMLLETIERVESA